MPSSLYKYETRVRPRTFIQYCNRGFQDQFFVNFFGKSTRPEGISRLILIDGPLKQSDLYCDAFKELIIEKINYVGFRYKKCEGASKNQFDELNNALDYLTEYMNLFDVLSHRAKAKVVAALTTHKETIKKIATDNSVDIRGCVRQGSEHFCISRQLPARYEKVMQRVLKSFMPDQPQQLQSLHRKKDEFPLAF